MAESQEKQQPHKQQQQHQDQQQLSQSTKRTLLVSAAVFLVLGAVAALAAAVLCTTGGRQCGASLSRSTQQQHNQGGSSSSIRWPGECPAYKSSSTPKDPATPPLLLGGVHGACQAGCQPRDTMWSDSCKMDPHSKNTWGLCQAQQRPALVDFAASLHNGSMLSFSPCDLYKLIKGRTLWLVGDSHMKNAYTATRCLMLDFWDHSLGECAAADDPTLQLELHKAELYAPRNHTLSDITEPRCVHLIGGGRICFLHAVRGELLVSGDVQKPGVLQLAQQRQLAAPEDVFYVSFGRWYTHNCTNIELDAYQQSLATLSDYYQKTKAQWPHVLFGVPAFDHSTCNTTFDYKKEGQCPQAGQGTSVDMYSQISSHAHDILGRSGMPLIDTMNATLSLHWAHLGHDRSFRGALDCLHYCRPGIPEMDVWSLYSAMRAHGITRLQHAARQNGQDAASGGVVGSSSSSSVVQTADIKCHRLKPFL